MASGGYRKPANPAMVSGPGELSARTDGGPGQPQMPVSGLPYGQNQAVNQMQGAAPMMDTSDTGAPPIIPLHAPSQRPGEPVTAGVPVGPGPGPEVLSNTPYRRVTDMLASMLGNDISGDLEALYMEAERLNM
jgi:hypothetical protein